MDKLNTAVYQGKEYRLPKALDREVVDTLSFKREIVEKKTLNYSDREKIKISDKYMYMVKGTPQGDKIILDVTEGGYTPVTDQKLVDKLISEYSHELCNYHPKDGKYSKAKLQERLEKIWGMGEEAAEILCDTVEKQIHVFSSKEIPIAGIPPLLFGVVGAAAVPRGTGFYRRFGATPITRLKTHKKRVICEKGASIFLTPLAKVPYLGKGIANHELTHLAQYAAFYNMIDGDSMLYEKTEHKEKQDSILKTVKTWDSYYGTLIGAMTRDLSPEMVRKMRKLETLLTDSPDETYTFIQDNKELVASAYFQKAYRKGCNMYEASASSKKQNVAFLLLPFGINESISLATGSAATVGKMVESAASNAIVVLPLTYLIARCFGYGNISKAGKAKKGISKQQSALEQISEVTMLGAYKEIKKQNAVNTCQNTP